MNESKQYILAAKTVDAFQWSGDRFANDMPAWAWQAIEDGKLAMLGGQPGMLVRDKFGFVVVAMAGDFIVRAGDDVARLDERTFKRLFAEKVEFAATHGEKVL